MAIAANVRQTMEDVLEDFGGGETPLNPSQRYVIEETLAADAAGVDVYAAQFAARISARIDAVHGLDVDV